MGKVYLFNPQPSEGTSGTLSAVNNAQPAYVIPFARKQFDYIPSSTSGNRSNSVSDNNNNFAPTNKFLVRGIPPDELYELDLPGPQAADLILYIFVRTLLLFGSEGLFLKSYSPIQDECRHESRTPPLEANAANGVVYVFNLFNEQMNPFSPNGLSAGMIAGWSSGRGDEPPIYTPNVLKVDRVLNSSQGAGHIFNGRNNIYLARPSRVGAFTLPIAGDQYPITQNLFLFVLRDQWFLADTYGVEKLEGRID
jgi:hypothetical protein